ncbi:MAG: Monoterpene epsilon-lactone hydrolase [Chloroflexi bacterium ADurb.Bin180]|nr:MAG: Monoterpene epsilon-lactone hydrolase [Chloroflexi bacterium ADurb.Bin180]
MTTNKLSLRARLLRPIWSSVVAQVGRYDTVQELRAMQAGRAIKPQVPRGVTRETVLAGGVAAEWLVPEKAQRGVLFYLHGGAWTLGYYQPHRWMVAKMAQATERRALVLDYRLAPEHPFPAALDDCLAAYEWLLDQGARAQEIVIGGDSAGGNLTLAMLLALRDSRRPLPAAAVCLSPVTALVPPEGVELAPVDAPQVRDAGLPVEWAQNQLASYVGDNDPRQPLISPYYGHLRGLPPLLIQAGGNEWLREDAARFTAKAQEAGADVTLQVWPGMWHVWQILVGWMPEADRAVEEIAAFCRRQQAQGGGEGVKQAAKEDGTRQSRPSSGNSSEGTS